MSTENKTEIKRDFAPHRRCSIRICERCGKVYIMSDNDIVYYATKYNQLPIRCPECREVRRNYSFKTKEEKGDN